jgi:hypothetical protein
MNENGNQYALAALKDKRATLAGEIVDLKKQLAWRVSQLALQLRFVLGVGATRLGLVGAPPE